MDNFDDVKKCAWCDEEYEVCEMKKELYLGYLCDRCIRAIESRGEKLIFEEGI